MPCRKTRRCANSHEHAHFCKIAFLFLGVGATVAEQVLSTAFKPFPAMILSRSSSSAELLARLASGGLAGSSSGLGAATGHGLHDASAWMASWQTMAASNMQQLRCKVFTSNVMDDTRSQRIAERRAYMLAKKEWRKEVNHRLLQWRAELKAAELEARAAAAKIRADTETHGGGEHPALAAQQHLLKMQEELRKAQLDHDVVRVFSGWLCFGTARLAEREFTRCRMQKLPC